ncbi:MAG: hypothetical protein ACOC6P_01930 [Candidatus Aminicenantaceae bacterium]
MKFRQSPVPIIPYFARFEKRDIVGLVPEQSKPTKRTKWTK